MTAPASALDSFLLSLVSAPAFFGGGLEVELEAEVADPTEVVDPLLALLSAAAAAASAAGPRAVLLGGGGGGCRNWMSMRGTGFLGGGLVVAAPLGG